MSVSVFTFASSVFWLSLSIIVCALLKRKGSFINKYGITPLIVLLCLGIARFFIPVELPFTKVIRSGNVLSNLQLFMRKSIYTGSRINITVGQVHVILWLSVSAILLLKIVIDMIKQKKYIAEMCRVGDVSQAEAILEKISIEMTGKTADVQVIISEEVRLPMMTGIRHPIFLLPDIQISDEDLGFILRHEWCHFLNRDIWIKLFMSVFRAIFWWNPLVYILKHDLDNMLEIRCDHLATRGLNEYDKLKYAEAACGLIKLTNVTHIKYPLCSAGLSSTGDAVKLSQRFQFVLSERAKVSTKSKILVGVILVFAVFISYAFVLQPESHPDIISEGVFEVTPENSYIMLIDGEYVLYINDIPAGVLDESDLDVSPHDKLKIIKWKEDC